MTSAAPQAPAPSAPTAPRGFRTHIANVGIKDSTDDFVVIASDVPCATVGLFTRSRFAGPSVEVSRRHAASGVARAIVTVSKNANVANGPIGERDAQEVVAGVAAALQAPAEDVLIASTGVIGRPYPMARVRAHLARMGPYSLGTPDLLAAARGIMTTDTAPKVASAQAGEARVVGIAKGVGMIEPQLATMLAYVLTDADLGYRDLSTAFRGVVERTFNCLSIDTDTSTSDTALLLASGLAGAVPVDAFEAALESVCRSLVLQIARDGEGATKLLEVTVDGASDIAQARRVAKSVVNSPLVKTAVHGADPNWGRVAMAVGKCQDDLEIRPELVTIRFAGREVYPRQLDEAGLAELAALLGADEVRIGVDLGIGAATATVWGCDLSDGYIRINADYTS